MFDRIIDEARAPVEEDDKTGKRQDVEAMARAFEEE